MEGHIKTATLVANLLDNTVNIFGLKFGINFIINLLPGLGDVIAALLSLYIIWIAVRLKVPAIRILQMLLNVAVNFFVGLIPVLGDTVYLFHHSNLINLKILKKYKTSIVDGEIL